MAVSFFQVNTNMASSVNDNFRIFLHLSDSAEIVQIADPIRKSVQDKYWVCLCYRPQRSCGQDNIFTSVCHSVHRGVSGADPPGADTPRAGTPPGRHTPPGRYTPPGKYTPPIFFFDFYFFGDIPTPPSCLRHMVNEWPVRILLECILVFLLILPAKLVLQSTTLQ